MQALELKVYEIFKSRFSPQEAETVIEYFDAKAEKKYEEKKEVLATKDDVLAIRKEIAESKSDLLKWIVGMWIAQMATMLILFLKK